MSNYTVDWYNYITYITVICYHGFRKINYEILLKPFLNQYNYQISVMIHAHIDITGYIAFNKLSNKTYSLAN